MLASAAARMIAVHRACQVNVASWRHHSPVTVDAVAVVNVVKHQFHYADFPVRRSFGEVGVMEFGLYFGRCRHSVSAAVPHDVITSSTTALDPLPLHLCIFFV